MTRVRINLAVFALLATATILWSVVSLFDIDRLEHPYTVTAEFESSPGLSPGFQVTYLGTQIGSVRSVELQPGKSLVKLKIDDEVEIPRAVTAQARRQSAIGEPYVNLSPKNPDNTDQGPRLSDGNVIKLEDTTIPINYADLFTAFDELVNAVEPEQLEILMHEVAVALDGRGDELRTLVVGARDLTDDLVANADDIDALLTDLGSLAKTAADNRDSIEASLDALTAVSESLGDLEGPIDSLLTDAPPFVALLNRILEQGDQSLLCALDGLSVLEEIVTPEVLAALSQGLTDADETRQIIKDAVKDDGIGQFDFSLSSNEEAAVYESPAPQPKVPAVRGCEGFNVEFDGAGESSKGALGPGGDGSSTDGTADVPPPTEKADVSLAGSSDLGEPDDPFLAKVLGWAVPAVAVALLAAALWLLYGFLRDRGRTV